MTLHASPATPAVITVPAGGNATPDVHAPNRHRWKILGIGVLANGSFSAAFSGIPVTGIVMRTDYRLDNATLGLALGSLGLGVAISELPWGVLTDRWGDRRVLLTGLLATALALAAMAWWVAPGAGAPPSMLLLSAGLLLVGLLGGSVNGSSGRAVMGWFREGERGLAMSIRQTAVPLGGGIGALVLPALAVAHGFAAVYGLLALFCLISALMAWHWLHEPPAQSAHPAGTAAAISKNSGKSGGKHSALHDSKVWRVALALGILCFPQVSVLTFASIFLHDAGHASLLLISSTMAAVQIGAAIMRVWSGRWTDRHGNRRSYLRTCSALSVLLYVALGLLSVLAVETPVWPWWLLTAIVAVLVGGGICASAWHGVAYTELATLAGARQVGTALGLGNTCVFLVFFLAAQAVPALLHWASWPAVWCAGAVAALLAWPIFLKPE